MTGQPTTTEDERLISNRMLFRITATIGVLAVVMALITLAGKWIGEDMILAGHTASSERFTIIVGQDTLSLPANVIRFETQRRSGRSERVSIYLSWPGLEGYSPSNAALFSDPSQAGGLLFAEFSQSVMSRDMSGRLEPIYARLFSGVPEAGPAGLTLHHLDPKSGFGEEVVLTGKMADGADYVVRCLMPSPTTAGSAADCQRDIHVGKDLTLLYRFSSSLLPHWQALDTSLRQFATAHLLD